MDFEEGDDEELADQLRAAGWVCYRKKVYPRKWLAVAESADGEHSVSVRRPTRDHAAMSVEDAIHAYVGSNPDSGPIRGWRYRVERNTQEH